MLLFTLQVLLFLGIQDICVDRHTGKRVRYDVGTEYNTKRPHRLLHVSSAKPQMQTPDKRHYTTFANTHTITHTHHNVLVDTRLQSTVWRRQDRRYAAPIYCYRARPVHPSIPPILAHQRLRPKPRRSPFRTLSP